MAENEDLSELLFFDTFSHEVDMDINLDLVQFPKPVYITQVRIIPLGARVQADFPGGVRLGATNPSKFGIEFFVNDLGMPGASTFENLGHLEYNQNDCIHLECSQEKIPTDGLVLRGWYSTITLAVYGVLTNTVTEQIASPPPPAPLDPATSEEVCSDGTSANTNVLPAVTLPPDEPEKEDWKEPILNEPSLTHKSNASEYIERDDLEYAMASREGAAVYYHSEDERERRMRKASHSSDRSSSRNRTHSESNERDYIRGRNERERERDRERGGEKTREWSRSPDYSRRSRRKRSERSRSDVEDSAQKWPRTPPALIDSPGRPRSPDGLEYDDSEDLIVNSGHYKIKSRSYLPASSESLTSPAGQLNQDLSILNDDDETPGTPGEQFEPILSDDELIGGNDDSSEQAPPPDEFEMEIDIAARSVSPAIHEFDPYKMPLQKFESDLNSFYSKDLENLSTIFAKFGEQTKVSSLEKYTASSTGVDDRETFVFLCEQLINQLAFLSQNYKRRNFVLGQFFKKNESNLEHAFNIIRIALDFEAACLQTQPAFKIRHIKIGSRLVELLGSSIEFMDYLLLKQKFDPFSAVFSLYEQEFMAMSIKLMLLKSIYALLDTKLGIETLLNSKTNGYHWLLQHIQQTSLTRTKYALKSILKKLHLNESLECIHENCSKLFVLENIQTSKESFRLIELSIVQVMDALVGNVLSFQQPRRFLPVSKKFEVVVDNNAQRSYINMLQSYLKMYSLGECLLLLLINLCYLPATLLMSTMDLLQVLVQTQVGIDYFVDDCFETTQVLVAALLGLKNEVQNEDEEKPLQEKQDNVVVIKKEEEDKFDVDDNKSSNIATENNSGVEQNVLCEAKTIITTTTTSTEENNSSIGVSKSTNSPEKDSENEESKQNLETFCKTFEPAVVKPLTLNRLQKLGIELAYKIQTRYHLDAIIFAASSAVPEYDAIKLATHLHALYSQTCNPVGRQHTVQFIGSNNNLQIFMDLIKKEQRLQAQQQSKAPGSKYKSPVLSYAVDMLDCCVRYCENLDYLVEHGAKILELAKNHDTFEPSVSAVLQEMFVYLRPLEVINIFAYDDVGPLVEVITRSLEYITTFPGDLIMGLRILHYLVIGRSITTKQYEIYSQMAAQGTVTSVADTEELRHRFVLLQFYAADGVQILMQILERLCYYFDQPGLHAPALVTIQGTHCCQIVLPTLQILGEMLAFAIQCRDAAFKDVTAIDHLMKTYYLMHYFPSDSPSEPEATLAKKEIVKILLSYTQPNEQGEEFLHKSLWTQMVREVLKNIVNGPSTYIPGLKVLAELLPLPLPLPTLTPLSPEQTQRLITERKLWSAHLHPQSSQIAKFIETIIPTSFPQLSNLLARVCLQLADLAPNMTLLISKTITDLMCGEWAASANKPTPHLARLLHFFCQIVMYPSVKSSALSILSGKVWDLFQTILCTPGAELTEVHIKCQLFIQRSLESFMDSEISLMSSQCTKNAEVNLASALPPKELIPRIAEAVLTNLLRMELTDEVASLAARNLVIMTEHDIMFYHLVQQLRQRRSDFQQWLQTLVASLKTGEYNSLIEIILILMRSLLHLEEEPPSTSLGSNIPPRTLKLTANELAYIIGLKKEPKDSEGINLLQQLTNALEHRKLKTNIPSSVFIDINTLITELQPVDTNSPIESDEDSVSVSASLSEPQLPQTEGIVTQYSTRPIFTIYELGSGATQLSSQFWLEPLCINTLSKEDLDAQCSRIPCDLTELATSCLSADTNLSADCKRLLHLSASPQSNRERTPTAPCFRTRRVEVEPSTGRPEKNIYITPVRGRGGGFSRAPPSRGDLFRSRPPNTSRPPSLHVDDFLALETCGAQPTGPTGYNKIPSIIRGSRVGRNRGLRISTTGSYRKPKPLRTSSPSTWNDGVVSSTHYRSTTTPDGVGSHFGSDTHYSVGSSSHFSGRSRGRGGRSRSYLR